MKKKLSAALAATLAAYMGIQSFPICAMASAGVSQHTNGNVYIEGNVTGYNKGVVDSVTLKLSDNKTNKIVYFDELEVEKDKSYRTKFKLNGDASDLAVSIMYNGASLNDSLEVAKVDGISGMVSARAVLVNQSGRVLELSDTDKPVHEYGTYSYKGDSGTVKIPCSYTSAIPYEDNTAAGVKVYINNKYGDDVDYTVMLAYYDENGKMISVNEMDNSKADFSAYNDEAVITKMTDIPQNAASVKAYVWYNGYSMIPFNNTANDKLESKTLYLVGDSTFAKWQNNSYPMAGVGMFIPDYFNTKYLTVDNRSVSGWTAKSFFTSGSWNKIMAALKPGDYVFITVGINDFGSYSKEDYQGYLETMILDAESKGATVLLGTAVGMMATQVNGYGVPLETGTAIVERPIFENLKKLHPQIEIIDLAAEAVNRAAKNTEIVGDGTLTDQQVMQNVLKMYHLSSQYMGEWGLNEQALASHNNSYLKNGTYDDCHLNLRGADTYASIFADLINASDLDLKDYLR